MGIVNDAYIKALLKTVYMKGVYNNKYQNSPILHDIKKESWEGGKEIRYAAQYGNGGNFGSNYNLVATNQTGGVRNLEWAMEPGYAFGLFNINQPEILSTSEERGAYMKALNNKMAGAFDGLSKTLAMYLYGGKAGVIDTVKASATLAATGNTLTITSAGAIKLDVGSRIVFAQGTPTGTLYGSGAYATVTNIDDNDITFDCQTGLVGVSLSAGDYIELYTARTGNVFSGIEGLPDIIPYFEDRTGTNWTSYIATDFRGVDRSVAPSRLAGQFVKNAGTGSTPLTDALVSLLKKTKRAGGINDIIVINDETFEKVGAELGLQRNLWQATNEANPSKQSATAGYNKLGVAFSDAFIGRTVVDPYCPEDKAWMFEMDDLKLYDMGNVSKALDPVANDELGKADIESVGDGGFGDRIGAEINIDKLFTVEPGTSGMYGPELTISANVYANFALRKTSSSGVASLA